ncbi:MAG: type II toxin-antitoxin system VapC family toxin [Chloroflexi bacterium]|nr:MAG: type II toxin-antitoxin system VapC family toxin [Chloroflexota bacterium]
MSGRNASGGSLGELLLDTDVCIDHLRGARALNLVGHTVSYSVVTQCELYSGRANESNVERFLSPFRAIVIDGGIAKRAGRLRREWAITTPDALIAATALEHSLELVTRNRRDFESVRGLRLRDPATISS